MFELILCVDDTKYSRSFYDTFDDISFSIFVYEFKGIFIAMREKNHYEKKTR